MKKINLFLLLMLLSTSNISFAQDTIEKDIRKEVLGDLISEEESVESDSDLLFVQKENIVQIKQKKIEEAKKIDNTKNFLLALQLKQLDIISNYLKNGLDINTKIFLNNTAVHISAMQGDINYLEFLYQNKANLNLLNSSNQNIIHLASAKNSIEYLIKLKEILPEKDFKSLLLQKSKYGRTPLHELVLYAKGVNQNTVKSIEFLTKNGINPNLQDENGQTAVHYAISLGNIDLIEFLVKNGASLKVRDMNDKTIQDFAFENVDLLNYHKLYNLFDNEGKKNIETKLSSLYVPSDFKKNGISPNKEIENLDAYKTENKPKIISKPLKLN